MNRHHPFPLTVTVIITAFAFAHHTSPLPRLFRSQNETVIEREYPFVNSGTLTIRNIEGNIRVQTEWRGSIGLRAVKRASNEEQLQRITVEKYTTEKDGHTSVTISSNYETPDIDGAVDYTLTVPTHVNLRLRTGQGAISVQDVQGVIVAQTRDGNIDIERITGPVIAQSKTKGNISIDSVSGGIKAGAKHGNITIDGATKSVIATNIEGKIEVNFKKMPETSRVVLHSQSGSVSAHMPSHFNAHLIGKGDGVTINSDHYIALRPTTKLEKEVSAYCTELARRVCHCAEGTDDNDDETVVEKGLSIAKKVRDRLAKAIKYVYPFNKVI